MSIENHPNLNAVGFLVGITEALQRNLRGKASDSEIRVLIMELMLPRIKGFVDEIDEHIDIAIEFTKYNDKRL